AQCLGRARATRAVVEVIADHDRTRVQRADHDVVDKRVGWQARELARERLDDDAIGAGLAEELDAALHRREHDGRAAERRRWMRIERQRDDACAMWSRERARA